MSDFEPVFAALRRLLERPASRLFVKVDEPGNYYLETATFSNRGMRMFFGAVQIKKSYVSFHLIPVYGCPALREGMIPIVPVSILDFQEIAGLVPGDVPVIIESIVSVQQ